MSDLQSLKRKIYEDGNVAQLLDALECENIHYEQGRKKVMAQLPAKFGSDNKRSIQINNDEGLSAHIRSRSIQGDIFAIVAYILYGADTFDKVKENLYQCKIFVCNTLGYDDFLRNRGKEQENDFLFFMRDIKKYRSALPDDGSNKSNEVLDESILNQYFQLPHIKLYEEGISLKTQREFEIGFDMHTERITFPIRNRDGKLIGVKGRYAGTDEDVIAEKKYLYLYRLDKSIELYNLHRALPHIKQHGKVIVVEGGKTCMFLDQWDFKYCVSIEGKELTPVQAWLLKELNVEIEFAWDKDCDASFIVKQLSQIRSRVPTVIYDTQGLLDGHDSPTDRGIDVWRRLYTECRYNQIKLD